MDSKKLGLNGATSLTGQLLSCFAVTTAAFLANSAIVLLIWVEGSDMTTIDNPAPNEPGILTHPLSISWKLLLGLVLLLNLLLLGRLLARRQFWSALALGLGAALPMFYLVRIMFGLVS